MTKYNQIPVVYIKDEDVWLDQYARKIENAKINIFDEDIIESVDEKELISLNGIEYLTNMKLKSEYDIFVSLTSGSLILRVHNNNSNYTLSLMDIETIMKKKMSILLNSEILRRLKTNYATKLGKKEMNEAKILELKNEIAILEEEITNINNSLKIFDNYPDILLLLKGGVL